MTELLTLNKKDAKFTSYLNGTFSRTHRALPLQSLNVNTEQEQVTFQIVPCQKIYASGIWQRCRAGLRALKIRHWGLWFVPTCLIASLNLQNGHELSGAYLSSALGALFLLITAGLRNEVRDHLNGLDRLFPQAGSQVIQQGWFAAHQLTKVSVMFVLLAVICGLPAVIQDPHILWLIAVVAVFSAWIHFGDSVGIKFRHLTEWLVFFILGPFLTMGLQLSAGAPLTAQVFYIGFLCGGAALYFLFMKNWTQILVLGQAHLHNHNLNNTVTWLGFEKSKILLEKSWLALMTGWLVYHWFFSSAFWFTVMLLSTLFVSISMLRILRRINSPVGSGLHIFKRVSIYSLTFLFSLWVLQSFWSLLF